MKIAPNSTILFQGDSITDAGRNRDDQKPNTNAIGFGYSQMLAGRILDQNAGKKLKIFNRGISGNRVVDLYARWKIDAINLHPDIISILIGVNDTWHEFNNQNGVEVDRYEMVYRQLLDFTKENLPKVKLILCEPFVLPCGVVKKSWVKEINQRRVIVKKLAKDYSSVFVPFQSAFDARLKDAPADYWCADGVHPTPAGHNLMAEAWLKAVAAA